MLDNYNFKDAQYDVKSLIHLFNLQGKDLIGLELGVLRAESFCSILQNCPNVKTLYGVDSWKPYTDILGAPYSMTEQQQEMHKFTAQHLIKYSGLKDKAVIIEKDSVEASKEIEDVSLDFIFLDAYLDYESTMRDLETWYPKVKTDGLFTGHDWHSPTVQKAVTEFRNKRNITENLSTFDSAWAWRKHD